jgi:hypothetical protein
MSTSNIYQMNYVFNSSMFDLANVLPPCGLPATDQRVESESIPARLKSGHEKQIITGGNNMKKQWIIIGTLVAVLAVAGTVFGLNRGAGEKVQVALSSQATDATVDEPEIMSGGENLSEFISSEENLQESDTNASHPIPVYEGEPPNEEIYPEGCVIPWEDLYQFMPK